MAFESLSDKLQAVFKGLKGKGILSDKDVKDALREVKLALLEADVNFKVVKEFINNVTEKAVGDEILKGLNPGDHVIKIVRDELIILMGQSGSKLTFSSKSPTIYMMVGLQGAGKTTTIGKLAGQLRKQGKTPLLAACDIYRPAAIKQLEVVGGNFNVPVYSEKDNKNAVEIAKNAVETAIKKGNDIVLIDTAGRLHIDDELMDELVHIKDAIRPQEILLVVDAMTGQDAVTVADTFNTKLGIDGVILTKLDGDTRGGAALSVRHVTKKPIKFIGMGEKMEDLEAFHPDRMASRILGMGDVLTLIEKAESAIDHDKALELENKMKSNDMDFDDFLSMMQQVKQMGPIKDLLGMIPGMNKINLNDVDINEKSMVHVEAIIKSMTKEERKNPNIISGSRKRRIAAGSGRNVQEVNKLLKMFEEQKKMMKQFTNMGKSKKGMFKPPFMR